MTVGRRSQHDPWRSVAPDPRLLEMARAPSCPAQSSSLVPPASVSPGGICDAYVRNRPLRKIDETHRKCRLFLCLAHGEHVFALGDEFFANLGLFDLTRLAE